MLAFLACLFYAVFCLMVLQGAIAIFTYLKLMRYGISLEFIFGKKVAEQMEGSTNRIAAIAAISYLLFIICWHYA